MRPLDAPDTHLMRTTIIRLGHPLARTCRAQLSRAAGAEAGAGAGGAGGAGPDPIGGAWARG
jgi:hypothetical protein